MKWVVLAILLCIIPYTWLTLRYRKPGPAYQPYEDNKARATVLRLRDAGFQRITVSAERPAAPAPTPDAGDPAVVSERPGGLPPLLGETLIDKPPVPEAIIAVTAAREVPADAPYAIQFACTLPNDREQLSGAELYVRDAEITIVPSFEKIGGDVPARTRDSPLLLTVPAGKLKRGQYIVTLIGARRSQEWTLEVR